MDDTATYGETRGQSRAKSVQEHIDELPMWADGTGLRSAPMTGMQWLIWSLAAAGKFFEGFVVFMTGVALPLFERIRHRPGRAWRHQRSEPVRHPRRRGRPRRLSDRFGRKTMFVVEMVIFVAFLWRSCFAPNYI